MAAVLRHRPGVWIGDNRFEMYANPGQRVDRALTIWDTTRGLGRIREEFWPIITLGIGTLRAVGFSEALTQHLWHGILIAVGGMGMVSLMRFWEPRIGLAHWAAALVFMFGPFSASFLLPSNLYINYSAAPWLVLWVLRGIREPTKWRAPAAIALTLGALGNVDYAGVMFAVLFAGLAGVAHVASTPARRWRDIVSFGVRTAVVTIPVNAAALFKTALSAEVFAQRIRDTETEIVSVASSWSESFRGLGSWLLYITDRSGPTRPQASVFLVNDLVVVATFVVPIVAILAVLTRHRSRSVFGTLMLVGAAFMVGRYPIDSEPLWGQLLAAGRDNIPQLGGLRNGYKAGSGLMMGTSGLVGVAIARSWDWLHARESPGRAGRILASAVGLAVLMAVSSPFWRGPLYNPAWELDEVPVHVTDFVGSMNAQAAIDGHNQRVLVIPGSTRNGFRWGWVNDDYLDAWIDQPQTTNTAIELSRPVSADLLQHLDLAIDADIGDQLTGQIARRIGADQVVIRNDHRWEVWGQTPPAELDDIRDDPDLELVATFGEPGEFTASGFDVSELGDRARELPPIEVYQVRAAPPVVSLRTEPTAVVSGGGAAYGALQAVGLLGDRSLTFSGTMSSPDLRTALDDGAPLFITDTNQRQEVAITLDRRLSWTLADGDAFDRAIIDLFDEPASQTVATFGSVARLTASNDALRFDQTARPGLAFDGQAATAWVTGVTRAGTAPSLRIDFAEPQAIAEIEVLVATELAGPDLTGIEVHFSSGEVVVMTGGNYEDTFTVSSTDVPPGPVAWLELRLTEIRGQQAGLIGLAEVQLHGAEVIDGLAVPHDVRDAAATDPQLREALTRTPTAWVFNRAGTAQVSARDFTSFAPASVELRGELRLGANPSDATLAAIANSPVRAEASSREGDGLSGWAAWAVDADPVSAWLGAAEPGQWLQASFEPRTVTRVGLLVDHGPTRSSITHATVELGAGNVTVPLAFSGGCEQSLGPAGSCWERVSADLPETAGVEVDTLRVTIDGVDQRGIQTRAELPIAVHSILLNGDAIGPVFGSPGCAVEVASVDGRAVTAQLDRPLDEMIDGPAQAAAFTGCEPVDLATGDHRFVPVPGLHIENIAIGPAELLAAIPPAAEGAEPVAQITSTTRVGWTVAVPDGASGWLSIGQSWDPRWRAVQNGVDLGPPSSRDTLAAWELSEGGTVEISFPPQGRFELMLAVSGLSTLVAAVLWLRGRRQRVSSPPPTADGIADETAGAMTLTRGRRLALSGATLAVGVAFGSWIGLIVGAAALVMGRGGPAVLLRRTTIGAAVLLGVSAIDTALGADVVSRSYADQRDLAHAAATIAAILLATAVATLLLSRDRDETPWRETG